LTHGAVRFLIGALEAILLVLLLSAAVLAWRLSQGPVTLNAFAPYIASAFSDLAPGFRFRIEGAELRWTSLARPPELSVRDVRITDAQDVVIAGLPRMEVRLSSAALLRGALAPEHVRLSNPIIRFVHRADGSLGLGVEGTAPASATATTSATTPAAAPATASDPASGNAVAASLIVALTRPAGKSNVAGYLDRIVIDGTTLVLVDEVSGQRWLVPDATLNFRRAGGELEINATLPVTEDGKRWEVTAQGRYAAATNILKVDINIEGFRPSRVAGLAPQLAPFGIIDLRVNGKASATATLDSSGARLKDLQFDVKGDEGQLRLPAPVNQSYPVRNVYLKGSAGADLDRIAIEQLHVELSRGRESPVITLTGEGKSLNSAPVFEANINMAALSLAALKEYWPEEVKPNTREWIANNLSAGSLSDSRFKLRLDGPNMASLDVTEARLSAKLSGVTVNYIRNMPKVENTEGVLNIGANEVGIDILGGHVPDAVSGRGLRVPTGKVLLYGLGSKSERANIKLKILGGFGDVMRLIDHEPLGYASSVGVDANRATGEADVDLTLDFPLVKDLRFDDIKVDVQAKAAGVGIPDVAFNLPLVDGNFALTLDRAGMDVKGRAALGGIQTAVDWRENFGGGAFRSRYVLEPQVDNAQRPLIGLTVMPFIPPYMDGQVPAHVTYTVMRDNTRLLDADVDLTQSVVALPELGYRKEPGKAAAAKVSVVFNNDKLESVPSFHVTAGDDLDVSGALTFHPDGKMRTLTFKPSIVGETRGSGEISVDEAGAYTVSVAGTDFNAATFLREINRNDAQEAGDAPRPVTPMTMHATFDRAWLGKESDFREVKLDFVRSAAGYQKIDFTSKVDGDTPFTLTLGNVDGKRTFTGSSVDGGSVVRAAGLFNDIVGGNLDIKGELAADGTVQGLAEIRGFKLVDAPVLARLLSVAALTGIMDELRGDGISFKELRVPFTYAKSTLTVKDAGMFGSALGLTAEGTYSFASSQMDFDGTVIPAYAINSALTSIPLIGKMLNGGAKGGGLFAATYSYRGDIATAQPSVNPLATFMPGFLRHIFDIFKPSSPQEARRQEKAD
jgi:hypothetical protein